MALSDDEVATLRRRVRGLKRACERELTGRVDSVVLPDDGEERMRTVSRARYVAQRVAGFEFVVRAHVQDGALLITLTRVSGPYG